MIFWITSENDEMIEPRPGNLLVKPVFLAEVHVRGLATQPQASVTVEVIPNVEMIGGRLGLSGLGGKYKRPKSKFAVNRAKSKITLTLSSNPPPPPLS